MDASPAAQPPPAKMSKRRWLRTLFVLTLLCAVGSAWVAKRLREMQLERAAIAQMEKRGASVLRINGSPRDPKTSLLGVWLERSLGEGFFSGITSLSLDGPIQDGALDPVANLPNLTELWINNAELTDKGLRPLQNLRHLEVLDLDVCWFTATDLEVSHPCNNWHAASVPVELPRLSN